MVLGWAAASGHFVKGVAERNHFVTSFGVIMFSDMGVKAQDLCELKVLLDLPQQPWL